MEKEKIDRINELARKAKTTELTAAEKEEQQGLRREYIDAMKASLAAQLDHMVIVDGAGNQQPVIKKGNGGEGHHPHGCCCGDPHCRH